MVTSIRKTPLDLARETLFRKSYTALVRNDGTLLPIEERLGRRLLRTLDPDSREAHGLLQRGDVCLMTSSGKNLAGVPVQEVLDRLRRETNAQLDRHRNDPEWRRRCERTLETLERRRRALARGH